MSSYIFLVALIATVVSIYADFYDPKYDSFDITPLLDNDRILLSFTKCFLEEGPCTPDAKDFKKVIPEALETSCEKCSPKQKLLIKTVIRTVMERHPDAWKKLVEKYDKDNTYRDRFNIFINEQ